MINVAQRRLQIMSGRVHPALAEEVANLLDVPIHTVQLSNFANGEISCRLGESVRDSDVFIIQTHGGPSINDAIMEQAIMIDAAKRASARSITAVCPFLGYARQDRKSGGREPITARLVVDIFSQAGADRMMSVDLHAGQIQGFFNGPFDHLIARPIIDEYAKKNIHTKDMVIVSPDAGRVKSAERYASDLGCDIAIIHKHRSTVKKHSVEARYLIGDVKGKTCLIVDDMIDTAGTVCAAADLLSENGATEIYGLATHGVLSDPALERIENSAFSKVVITNTLPSEPTVQSDKIVVLSIAPLIADAIAAIFAGNSVSALFHGENQF
ncbi:MAG TPA: ribose-phosphate diphosphokinase [Candidatus Saccharimonadales bacterium]|nr:ribose-phosphate diphosphokinase [Candidatus Saccharimonadales bacterium]